VVTLLPLRTLTNATLVFSYVGYTAQEVAVAGRNAISIQLTPELLGLDEVVVIGYGTARRSDLVGSTSSVSTADVVKQPAARIDQALQGRSPGLVIQNTSAAPDANFTIRIRGANSLSGSNDPLVVIDGFVGGSLSTINPNEIESLEVLKDASSTAIYGSRGANGVILVTTKKGAIGKKAVVEYNGYASVAQLAKRMDLLPAWQYAATINEHRIESGGSSVFTDAQIADLKAWGGTDWQDEVYRNALQQSHQVSVSGGSTGNSYYVSANMVDMPGIVLNSNMSRISFRSNIESTLTNRAKAGIKLFLSSTENHPVNIGNQDSGVASAALLFPPTVPVYLEAGGYSQPVAGYGPVTVYNPVATAVEPVRDNNSLRGELNTFLSYELAKGLSARTVFGATINDSENKSYTNTAIRNGIGQNSASISAGRDWLLQSTTQLNYMNRFAGAHDISATLAFEYQRETSNSYSAGASVFSSDAMGYNNLSLGSTISSPASGYSRKDILSYVGRLTYNYKDRYLVSINGRYDGASVFGDNKWGFFPSAALAWRINNESFMQQFSDINNLKLRASYGITGSQAVGAYASLSRMSTTARYAMGSTFSVVGVGLSSMANPYLEWEKNRSAQRWGRPGFI
jgi:TonB-dependent starch-binding outer membrane protein SusC